MHGEFVTIRVVLAQPDAAEHDCLVPAIVQGGLDKVFGRDSANDEVEKLDAEIEEAENVEALWPRIR